MIFYHFSRSPPPPFTMDNACKRSHALTTAWSTVKRQRPDESKEHRQFYCQNSPACFRLWWDDVPVCNPISTCKICHAQPKAIPIESQSGPALYSCNTCRRQWVKKGENCMFTEEICKGCCTVLKPVKVGTHLFGNKTETAQPT